VNPNISYVVTARGGDVAQKSNAGGGEEEEEEDLFVFNNTIEAPRVPAIKPGRVTPA
jgi:hypothetical protein